MVKTVLYAEKLYDNDKVEREVFGPDVRVVWRNVTNLSQLEERDCAEVDGLMVLRHAVTAAVISLGGGKSQSGTPLNRTNASSSTTGSPSGGVGEF